MKCVWKIFLVLLLCALLSACRQEDFNGSIVKNEVEFTLAFQSLRLSIDPMIHGLGYQFCAL